VSSQGGCIVAQEGTKNDTARFPGILQIQQRRDAEGFYLSKSAHKTICGLFVRTEIPLDKGVRVLTAVSIPKTDEPVFADCEVVWCKNNGNGKPAGMAVKFVTIAETDRKKLDMFFRPRPAAQAPHNQAPQAKQG